MLLDYNQLQKFLSVSIKGVIHIGAHECEEDKFYKQINVDKVIWIDALQHKVDEFKNKGFNIFQAVISDKDDESVNFNITNNLQSSSILELDTHLKHHPWVHVLARVVMKTKKLDTFVQENKVDMNNYNFLNLDIQGAELMALKGFSTNLDKIDYIYTEVNVEHLYKNCALLEDLDNFLSQYNFKRVLTDITQYKWGDAFYVKNK